MTITEVIEWALANGYRGGQIVWLTEAGGEFVESQPPEWLGSEPFIIEITPNLAGEPTAFVYRAPRPPGWTSDVHDATGGEPTMPARWREPSSNGMIHVGQEATPLTPIVGYHGFSFEPDDLPIARSKATSRRRRRSGTRVMTKGTFFFSALAVQMLDEAYGPGIGSSIPVITAVWGYARQVLAHGPAMERRGLNPTEALSLLNTVKGRACVSEFVVGFIRESLLWPVHRRKLDGLVWEMVSQPRTRSWFSEESRASVRAAIERHQAAGDPPIRIGRGAPLGVPS
ncbi:MAG: hypothetical protein ACLP1X_07085 [Polyangiaceae bacterium]